MTPGSCLIHLKDEARRRAAEASYPLPKIPYPEASTSAPDYLESLRQYEEEHAVDLQARRDFVGPHFKDCVAEVDFQTPGWVFVTLTCGTAYVYPAADVARTKIYRS